LRTLVVSDLHLGARSGVDVLRQQAALDALICALEGVDRLLVLGDLLELRHGPAREALNAATPVLASLGEALGAEREVVIVPGNHDHGLLRPWLARRSLQADPAPLGLESKVAFRDGDLLAKVARHLRPAQVRASYPGVWLREDVYATHGHYGDRHNTVPIMERVGAGLMTRLVPEPPGGPAATEDYEATLGPMYAWVEGIAQRDGSKLGVANGSLQVRAWTALAAPGGGSRPRFALAEMRRTGLKLAFPALVATLNRAGFGPLHADVSGPALRRAALRAFGEVLARLQVDAPYVLFGHTHRAGPLPRDDRSEWSAPTGASLVNSGCWVAERGLLGPDPSRSPYRPGFCVFVGESGQPEVRNILDQGASPGVKHTA
jgi:predicted phosphodiesterase